MGWPAGMDDRGDYPGGSLFTPSYGIQERKRRMAEDAAANLLAQGGDPNKVHMLKGLSGQGGGAYGAATGDVLDALRRTQGELPGGQVEPDQTLAPPDQSTAEMPAQKTAEVTKTTYFTPEPTAAPRMGQTGGADHEDAWWRQNRKDEY